MLCKHTIFLESILEKIASSDESENFIFKGGFYSQM